MTSIGSGGASNSTSRCPNSRAGRRRAATPDRPHDPWRRRTVLLRKVTFDDSKFITRKNSTPSPRNMSASRSTSRGSAEPDLRDQSALRPARHRHRDRHAAAADRDRRRGEDKADRRPVAGDQGHRQSADEGVLSAPGRRSSRRAKCSTSRSSIATSSRFNRTNDVQMRALLQPGTDFGLTDLQLAITEPAVNTLQPFYDNQGAEDDRQQRRRGIYYKMHGLGRFRRPLHRLWREIQAATSTVTSPTTFRSRHGEGASA